MVGLVYFRQYMATCTSVARCCSLGLFSGCRDRQFARCRDLSTVARSGRRQNDRPSIFISGLHSTRHEFGGKFEFWSANQICTTTSLTGSPPRVRLCQKLVPSPCKPPRSETGSLQRQSMERAHPWSPPVIAVSPSSVLFHCWTHDYAFVLPEHVSGAAVQATFSCGPLLLC